MYGLFLDRADAAAAQRTLRHAGRTCGWCLLGTVTTRWIHLRGDLGGRVFTAFWVHGGRVVAGMQANNWDATADIRRIVTARRCRYWTPLRDTQNPLADVGAI